MAGVTSSKNGTSRGQSSASSPSSSVAVSLSAEELVYLSARAKATPKITLPSPTLFINFWSPERSRDVYPTLDAYLADVVALLREEVAELSRLGATYIQLDAPHYHLPAKRHEP